MNTDDFSMGVICRGHPSGARKVCVWDKAFSDYLSGDAASDDEAYLSAFIYPKAEYIAHVNAHGFGGYQGPVWARYIPLDFDCEGNPADAIAAAQHLLCFIEAKASGDLGAVIVSYSGGKGVHVRLPIGGLMTAPAPDFPRICKGFAALLCRDAGVSHLDAAIYDGARLFRMPNSRHGKTGRLCVPILPADFIRMDAGAVIALGDGGRRDGTPSRPYSETWCSWELQGVWNRAADFVAKKAAAIPGNGSERDALNRATLEFIADGAANGERHSRLFSAACNLGEFGASEKLATALLTEAARDSGMPMKEITDTIAAGVAHGRKGAA